MIDFSTLKGLTIPEGNVKQITDAQGNVLWSAAPKVKFVPIVDLGTINPKQNPVVNLAEKPAGYDTCTHVIINGVVYEATGALSGTAFQYQISDSDSVYQIAVSTTNNVVIVSSHKEGAYTVQLGVCIQIRNDPATVALRCGAYASEYVDYAYVTFTDASGTACTIRSDLNGYQGTSGNPVSGAINYELPAGTIITCYVKSKNDYAPAYVKVNGTKVLNRSSSSSYGTYAYTVTGNATITLTTKPDKYGYIEITET